MKILHYILGFPPMRSGGLTKYAVDLMQSEKQMGHEVFATFPGNPTIFCRKKDIVARESYSGIGCFCIKNALLLPLLHGVKDPKHFISNRTDGIEAFRAFFSTQKFDVLHVHTLMGLPIAFLIAAKENGVKIVYTSHDYFGLCPKVSFISSQGDVCCYSDPEKCINCNTDAKPSWFLWLRNSRLLVVLKKLLKR